MISPSRETLVDFNSSEVNKLFEFSNRLNVRLAFGGSAPRGRFRNHTPTRYLLLRSLIWLRFVFTFSVRCGFSHGKQFFCSYGAVDENWIEKLRTERNSTRWTFENPLLFLRFKVQNGKVNIVNIWKKQWNKKRKFTNLIKIIAIFFSVEFCKMKL